MANFITKFFQSRLDPTTPPPTSAFSYERQGTAGASTVGGYLVTKERNPKLAGLTNRMRTFDEIQLNTAIVATAMRYFTALMNGMGWTVKPADAPQKKSAEKYAEAIDTMMNGMSTPWGRVVRRASQFKWNGFSVQERMIDRCDWIRDGMIGIVDVENRPQRTFEQWDIEEQSGEVLGWTQRDDLNGQVYPMNRSKCIYIFDDTLTSSPDGVGIMRHVVELSQQLKRLEQLEMWAFETDLRGVPLARAPIAILDDMVAKGRITEQEKTEKLKGINDFIDNHFRNPKLGLTLDSSVFSNADATRRPGQTPMWDLQLIRGNGSGLAEIHQAIDRKNHETARTLGVEQFMLGANGKGSNALSEDKTSNLLQQISSTANEIGSAMNRDYVLPTFALNGWDRRLAPTLVPNAVALRSVNEIVDAMLKLAQAGAPLMANDPVINQLRGMLNLLSQPHVSASEIAPNGDVPGQAVQGQGTGESKPKSGPSGMKGPEVT